MVACLAREGKNANSDSSKPSNTTRPTRSRMRDARTLTSCSRADFLPPKEAFPKAKAAALKALQFDPKLSEAVASLAPVKFHYDWDWDGAAAEVQRTLQMNPNDAFAHHFHGAFAARQGVFDDRPDTRHRGGTEMH